ncbi:MAG: mechanosensitive ion channel family protein [Thalassolituus sp.]|uniref:mechanosensitive ion channel family protein n=1 Tax=Thalassolituus TaxID=187492 RepID=UPI00240A8E07|nr:mechanosensitive ion channel family protein [Thalassolituus oleivorans]MDF1640472.1 mechanosensitive ion channel family protein [Thalassolituus oleivorans]
MEAFFKLYQAEGIAMLIILIATVVSAKIVKTTLNKIIEQGSKRLDYDSTGWIFARTTLVILIYIVGVGLALAKIPQFELVGHSLLAGAGVLTLVMGIASQQILSNLMSGVLIVLFRPFKLGDRISVNNMVGTVEDINLRQFVLRDLENNRIIIPNSSVGASALINFNHTDVRSCKAIEIGISYSSNIDLAMEIIRDEAMKHPLRVDGRNDKQIANNDPEVAVRVVQLADSAVILKLWVWAKDTADGFVLSCDLLKSIKERFDSEGIDIPFPQTTLSFLKDRQS